MARSTLESSPRRVRIDDCPPAALDRQDYEADCLQAGDEVLRVEEHEAQERERLAAEDREAERHYAALERSIYEAEIADGGGIGRERDLEAAPEVPRSPRKPGRVLTEQQLRVQSEWSEVSRPPVSHCWVDQEDGHEMTVWRPGDDLRSDKTARYLRDRDPDYEVRVAASEIATEVLRRLSWALRLVGQDEDQIAGSLRVALRIAFAPGKPTAARRATRRAVREALYDLYADGARHDLLAVELGCSRQALHALMSKP